MTETELKQNSALRDAPIGVFDSGVGGPTRRSSTSGIRPGFPTAINPGRPSRGFPNRLCVFYVHSR